MEDNCASMNQRQVQAKVKGVIEFLRENQRAKSRKNGSKNWVRRRCHQVDARRKSENELEGHQTELPGATGLKEGLGEKGKVAKFRFRFAMFEKNVPIRSVLNENLK